MVSRLGTHAAISSLSLLLLSCSAPPEAAAVDLWGRWEGVLTATSPVGDPDSVQLTITLESPSGKTHTRLGFWDGGSTWRVRFMPTEEGAWRYRASSTPAVDGLDGHEGKFASRRAASTDNVFLRHGAVRVAANGRHFEHADGAPFFWLSDTAWNGALLSSSEDWQTYLDDRKAKGFTAVQFVTTQWRTAYTNFERQVAYSGRDDIEIHPAFFERLDRRITALNEEGLLAVPVLLWTLGEDEYTPGKLPDDQAIRLARYLVARYGAHHVIWFLGGDGRYDGEESERWSKIGRAVFPDQDHAPVFHHPRGRHWPWQDYREETWLSALGYQSGHGDSDETWAWIHSGPPAQQWRDASPRPVVNLEPCYEDHVSYQSRQPHGAHNVRKALYWSLLNAPTAGTSYGAHGVWSWQREPAVPLNHNRAGVARPWHEAIHLEGSAQVKHLATLFTSLPWWRLRPAPALLASQPGEDDPNRFIAAALDEDGSVAVLYLPAGGTLRLRAGDSTLANLTEAEWFNPRTGDRSPATADVAVYRAPDRADWVLLMRQPRT